MLDRGTILGALVLFTACSGAMRETARPAAYSPRGVRVFVDGPSESGCKIIPRDHLRNRLVEQGFTVVQDKSAEHALDVTVTGNGSCNVKSVEVTAGGAVVDLVDSTYGYSDITEVVERLLASERIAAALRGESPSSPSTATATTTAAAKPVAKRKLAKHASLLLLPLKPVSGVSQSTCELLSGYMLGRLDAVEGLRTVGREDIEASLGADKQRAALGCDAIACMAEIGGALGVDLIMYGQVGRVGSKYSVNVSVVRATDSRVIARTSAMTEQTEDAIVAQMDPMISELVDKLDARN